MNTVVVVGSINSDIVVRAPRHPKPGETLIGSDLAFYPGGKGANQAVAAARAGADVRFIGRVGADAAGRDLTHHLASEGVDVTHVGVCKHDPTGTALITVSEDGENTIVVVAGGNEKLRPVHVEDSAEVFSDASVVLAQLEVPVGVVQRAFQIAKSAGVRTVLNAAPAQALEDALVDLVDILVVNEHELGVVSELMDAESGAASLLGRGVSHVVLTLGRNGAKVFSPGGALSLEGHRVEVVDTTGAGDAFCGVLAQGLAAGLSIDESAVRANAAGALAVTAAGAQSSSPTASEINAFLGQQ